MSQQIFLDPDRKRWRRLRRIFDVAAVLSTLVLVTFIINVIRRQTLPELLLPAQKRNYKALKENQPALKTKGARSTRRKTHRKPSDIPLNSDEGIRAAFYVDDEGSYSSLKQHIHQIDMLFPDWLHVMTPDGQLKASTALYPVHIYDVVDAAGVHGVDPENKVRRVIEANKEDTEVFPMVNDYNILTDQWGETVGALLKDPQATEHLRQQIDAFLAGSPQYRGIALDLEEVPDDAEDAYMAFVAKLYSDFRAKNLRLYVNVQVSADEDELHSLATTTDGVILMNYDEHESSSEPGPVASQDWFEGNLRRVLKIVPREKIICAMGNYGYDWTEQLPEKGTARPNAKLKVVDTRDLTVQEAWQEAADSDADVHLEGDELNAHFAYDDEDSHERHQVWFLDGVTALNEMRAARQMGLRTFVLWRLGKEDPTLWRVWDHPSAKDAQNALTDVPPGQDVDNEGDGDILRVTGRPANGTRTISMDAEKFTITDERMPVLPRSYTIRQYGYHPNQLALTFDDGPDPKWTPKILDILKQEKVKGTFFVIGEQAENNVGLLQRYIREGHEIGNHTFTHPDISDISSRQLELELNLTERLFASKLGLQPLYFRPPYSIDQEPDTNDQAAPIDLIEQMGYIIVGNKIDTEDWNERPRKSPQEITDGVLNQLAAMKDRPWFRGSIILLHDGGGDRSATVAALPLLIDTLRAKGYRIVPVSELLGKTTAEVMPPISPGARWQARVDSLAFIAYGVFVQFGVFVFFFGDVLMSGRLVLVGIFAVIDRFKTREFLEAETFQPRVAVLIPAYNEEKVIVRTVRSVLNSDYRNMRVIVIDDGSTDRTFEVAREAFAKEIAEERVTVLTKPNGGKAAALNFGIQHLDEDFYVGIDADTVIAPDAVSKLMRHFAAPETGSKIGAVAGNAKVGNRVNLWTRWQALEYITSQNFERRALDLFGVVTVVPGAIGAWRTAGVRRAGGYPVNTVAEDADLTMNLLEQGYRVVYEDRALAFTEAPVDMRGLMKQRFRWSFGTLQAIFKHRGAFTRNKAMGFFALPNILIFQLLLPLVSPLIDIMFVAGVIHYLVDRHFHPAAASAANFEKLLVYFLAFLVIDFLTSSLAFSLEPRHQANKGDGWLLFHIWLQRFAYRQVFSIVIFKTIKRAIDGRPFSWDKLDRTAKMSAATERIAAGS